MKNRSHRFLFCFLLWPAARDDVARSTRTLANNKKESPFNFQAALVVIPSVDGVVPIIRRETGQRARELNNVTESRTHSFVTPNDGCLTLFSFPDCRDWIVRDFGIA